MKKIVLFIFLIIAIASSLFFIVFKKQQDIDYHEGQEPSEEDKDKIEDYYSNCPFVKLSMVDEVGKKSNDFDIVDLKCNDAEGVEDITVEIYTSDFEQGKEAFRDWLAENGLQESDKLRVEYIHKPK